MDRKMKRQRKGKKERGIGERHEEVIEPDRETERNMKQRETKDREKMRQRERNKRRQRGETRKIVLLVFGLNPNLNWWKLMGLLLTDNLYWKWIMDFVSNWRGQKTSHYHWPMAINPVALTAWRHVVYHVTSRHSPCDVTSFTMWINIHCPEGMLRLEKGCIIFWLCLFCGWALSRLFCVL